MSAHTEQRKLTAVMFTDMTCYSALRPWVRSRANDPLFGKDES